MVNEDVVQILEQLGFDYKRFHIKLVKDGGYSANEIKILRTIEGVTVKLFGTGTGCLIDRDPEPADYECATTALAEIHDAMKSGKFDLVVCDEINVTMLLGFISEKDILDLISSKPDTVELVLTGRGATDKEIEMADLVTEMKEIKHYYSTKKLESRDGIEK
jgi:cob(I)alamin adenosyltransferase